MTEEAPVRLGRVEDLRGLALYELRVEEPERRVICVHGGLDRATSFSRVARRLGRSHVLAYDRRGYQGSRPLGPGTLLQHAEDLALVARERAPGAIIVGHSFGGLVALVASVLYPENISGVLCYESPVPWLVARPQASAPDVSDPAGEAERFFRRVVSSPAWERLSEAEQDSRHHDGPALVSDLSVLSDPEVVVDLSRSQIATLYAFGDGPSEPYYWRLAEALKVKNSLFGHQHVSGVGHGIHLSHPQTLADLVFSFQP